MDIDKNTWQHPALLTQFFSNNGCHFNITANFIEEDEMQDRRKRLKSGANVQAKMRNKLQNEINAHVEDDCLNRQAISKWNQKIRAHKKKIRAWEEDARASTFNARKKASIATRSPLADG